MKVLIEKKSVFALTIKIKTIYCVVELKKPLKIITQIPTHPYLK